MGRSSDWGDRFLFFRRDDIENSFMKIVGHYSKNDVQIIINGEFFFNIFHIISQYFFYFLFLNLTAIELSNDIELTIAMHWKMA